MVGYRLNQGHAMATANYIVDKRADPSTHIHSLIMHDNGCNDESFAAILDALISQNQLRHLTYSANQLRT